MELRNCKVCVGRGSRLCNQRRAASLGGGWQWWETSLETQGGIPGPKRLDCASRYWVVTGKINCAGWSEGEGRRQGEERSKQKTMYQVGETRRKFDEEVEVEQGNWEKTSRLGCQKVMGTWPRSTVMESWACYREARQKPHGRYHRHSQNGLKLGREMAIFHIILNI